VASSFVSTTISSCLHGAVRSRRSIAGVPCNPEVTTIGDTDFGCRLNRSSGVDEHAHQILRRSGAFAQHRLHAVGKLVTADPDKFSVAFHIPGASMVCEGCSAQAGYWYAQPVNAGTIVAKDATVAVRTVLGVAPLHCLLMCNNRPAVLGNALTNIERTRSEKPIPERGRLHFHARINERKRSPLLAALLRCR
jgi:hypothetical protein